MWYTPNQDSSDNDDGGWNSDTFIIDRGKSYRTSVWVKKETDTPADGNLYLGTNYVNSLNGNYNTNPYFINGNVLSSFENGSGICLLVIFLIVVILERLIIQKEVFTIEMVEKLIVPLF